MATTGGIIKITIHKTSPHLAEKFRGKNLDGTATSAHAERVIVLRVSGFRHRDSEKDFGGTNDRFARPVLVFHSGLSR